MQINYRNARSGSALIITLAVTGATGFALASYLFLVGQQNRSVMRSMAWNSSIPVIEAGIEEALAHLRLAGVTNLTSDDWTPVTGVSLGSQQYLTGLQYQKTGYLGSNYFVVTISQASPPVIISQGFVKAPLTDAYLPARVVRVNTRRDGLFPKGLVAKGSIDLNGKNIRSDSFDSADPSYSTGGRYDIAKFKAGGDVASNSSIIGIINQGNADIYGHVSTGPGGTVTTGPNGAAGSQAWIDGGNTGIEDGWFSDDMNVSFPDVEDPFTSGYSMPGGTPIMINSSGNYQLSNLTKSLVVRSNTTAVLKVTGSISLAGSDSITIEPGATLKLYMAGASASLGGNGVINLSGNATNFAYYGLPSNTSITFAGNGEFIGTIYAPSATFNLNGGGTGIQDFAGASITSTVKLNGHFNFHYDENLGPYGPDRGFVVTSWDEL